jgi:hypothetical protein
LSKNLAKSCKRIVRFLPNRRMLQEMDAKIQIDARFGADTMCALCEVRRALSA